MALFKAFHQGTLDAQRLNYGVITLLPKVSGAEKIQQFRPICLLRCPYKLITKVLDQRVAIYANKLISPTQNAFVKGRNIMDGVLSLHEILKYTYFKKKLGIFLNLDFEKSYFNVKMISSICLVEILFWPENTAIRNLKLTHEDLHARTKYSKESLFILQTVILCSTRFF